jgi:hypothetical protein
VDADASVRTSGNLKPDELPLRLLATNKEPGWFAKT